MKTKQIPISKFKAHCTEELRLIEETGVSLEITRHGKVIAIARVPEPEPVFQPDSFLGSGMKYGKFGPNYDPHKPAINHDEWMMHHEEKDSAS